MKYLIIIITGCLIASCQKSEKVKGIQKIRMSDIESSINLSDLVGIDSIVKIDPKGFYNLGEIKKAFRLEDRFLMHSSFPEALSILSSDGTIKSQYLPDYRLSKISSVDVHQDIIYALDRESMAIHTFNDSLIYREKFSIPFLAQSLKILQDNVVALYTGNDMTENSGKLVIYDLVNKKTLSDEIKISENQARYFNFLTSYNFFEVSNQVYFWDSAINELFSIGHKGATKQSFSLEYGKRAVPANFYEDATYENAYEFVVDARRKGYAHRHFKVLSNNNFIILNFDYGEQFATTLYNIKEDRSISFNEIYDDVWNNKNLEEMKLSFFTTFHGDNEFIAFLPFEYFESEKGTGSPSDDILIFGRLKFD